jgi:hypothetical protein
VGLRHGKRRLKAAERVAGVNDVAEGDATAAACSELVALDLCDAKSCDLTDDVVGERLVGRETNGALG